MKVSSKHKLNAPPWGFPNLVLIFTSSSLVLMLWLCSPVKAWSSHQALCGEGGGTRCTVSFGDEGITVDSIVIPVARLFGWSGIDKSERTCNIFGVCTRSLLMAERQEFTLSYLSDSGKKESVVISFINVNAAIKFRQEIEAFFQLVKATKGQAGPKLLTPEEATKDILTSSLPIDNGNINFGAWVELEPYSENGKSYKRYYAPSYVKKIGANIYEYPTFMSGEGITVNHIGRIDCIRSKVAVYEQSISGIDRNPYKSWTEITSITPGQMSFQIASKICSGGPQKR